MRKQRYYNENDSPLIRIISVIALFCFIYLAFQFLANRQNFWRLITYGVVAVIGLIVLIALWRGIRYYLAKKHLEEIMARLKNAGQEEYLENFISRFSFEGKNIKGWAFRNHKIDWDRINDLKEILKEKSIISKEEDVFSLLRIYIQKREEILTRESIRKEPQKFVSLTGAEFEKLLYRLFEAMGYKVEWIGKSGDQGGDLIANKDGERTLIQAKCYRDWSTGNDAVQQVVGAMKYYDCSKTKVVTTSADFTSEARALAKANSTELISKDRLSEMLMQCLGENWG